jgi:hypothetical protein
MCRRWVFTINFSDSVFGDNATKIRDEEIERLKTVLGSTARYAILGKETGDQSKNLHLQCYASMLQMYRLKGIKKLVGERAHCEPAKGNEEQNYNYCSKQGDFIEIGQRSEQGRRNDLLEIAKLIKAGTSLKDVAEIAPATYIRNYRGIAHYQSLQCEPYTHDSVRGIWLHGPPGVGKTHHARLFAASKGDVYVKSQNKWFDGYAGEPVILLDDLDCSGLGHLLKIWADKWSCNGEVKGGTVRLRHRYFIVTSNYTPASLWPDDSAMCQAVKRRFKMIICTGLVEHLKELI